MAKWFADYANGCRRRKEWPSGVDIVKQEFEKRSYLYDGKKDTHVGGVRCKGAFLNCRLLDGAGDRVGDQFDSYCGRPSG